MYNKSVLTEQYVVRASRVTATATITNGQITTLLAGDAASKLDLVQIGFSNASDAAVTVTLKDDGTTVNLYPVPAATANQFNYQFPIPQSAAGGNWEVSQPTASNTSVTIIAQFIKQ